MKFIKLSQTKFQDRPSAKTVLVRTDLVQSLISEGTGSKFKYLTERNKSFGNKLTVSEALAAVTTALTSAPAVLAPESFTLTAAQILEFNGRPYTGSALVMSRESLVKLEEIDGGQSLIWIVEKTGQETVNGFVKAYKIDLDADEVIALVQPAS